MPDPSELYVGYLPQAPPALARRTRRRVVVLLALVLAVSALLSASQGPFSTASYDLDHERTFEGWIAERPYAQLLVQRPGAGAGVSRYLLVGSVKFGVAKAVRGLDGRRVRLAGHLVHRADRTMIQLVPRSLEVVDGPPSPRPTAVGEAEGAGEEWVEDLGTHTFRGEIVDSKCFLGVMKPGNLKPHRACAVRCISGGIPPLLLIRDAEGNANYLLLASGDGGTVNGAVLDMVAEPVEMTGRLLRYDDLLVLRADPETFERVD